MSQKNQRICRAPTLKLQISINNPWYRAVRSLWCGWGSGVRLLSGMAGHVTELVPSCYALSARKDRVEGKGGVSCQWPKSAGVGQGGDWPESGGRNAGIILNDNSTAAPLLTHV